MLTFPRKSTTWEICRDIYIFMKFLKQIQVSAELDLQLQPHPNQFYSFHSLFWTSKLQDTLESCMNRCFSTGDALAEAKEADPGSMV